jgi:hypothetical protein
MAWVVRDGANQAEVYTPAGSEDRGRVDALRADGLESNSSKVRFRTEGRCDYRT